MAKPMKSLSEIIPAGDSVACPECGGFAFFDWGLKLLDTSYRSNAPRLQHYGDHNNVLICATCLHPVVERSGDFYDAADFVSRETIETVIQRGQAREHAVAAPRMDP